MIVETVGLMSYSFLVMDIFFAVFIFQFSSVSGPPSDLAQTSLVLVFTAGLEALHCRG